MGDAVADVDAPDRATCAAKFVECAATILAQPVNSPAGNSPRGAQGLRKSVRGGVMANNLRATDSPC
jgi:hypothetical protein